MAYQVLLVRRAEREFDSLSEGVRLKVFKVLELLQADPFQGKALKGPLSGCWTIRAWPFRVVYEVDQKKRVVYIVTITHRKDAYRHVSK